MSDAPDESRSNTFIIIMIVILLLAGTTVILIGCQGGPAMTEVEGRVTIGAIEWETDYDRALDRAKREDKPLWLHFGENPG